jgi:ABC-type transport system involved in multi-copper enzyme maturation permease subunit
MYKALATKELRETLGILVLALLAYLYFVSDAAGLSLLPWVSVQSQEIPFVGDAFRWSFAIVSGIFAVALGLRQTAWEDVAGTWQFLLHRPIARRRIIAAKLIFGAGAYLAVAALPILLYAWWAATPGTHASPFYWSMTSPTWQLWLSIGLLYLGAFLAGLRPGRWFGTRLAPLAAAGALVLLIVLLPWWWIFGLAAVLLVAALLLANILHVAQTRDYA